MYPQPMIVNNKYKTQLCRHFSLNGVCALALRCQFAHGQQELRSQNGKQYIQSEEQQTPQGFPMMQMPQYKVPGVNPMIANYKTQLCKHWNVTTGYCKNGPNCTFAHGEQELNTNPYMQNNQMIPQVFLDTNQQPNQKQFQNYQQLQAELTQSILVLILQNMEQIFPNQMEIISLLQKGQGLALQGQTQEASDIIKQIIHDQDRSKEEKQQYQQIYNNAQRSYDQKMKELQQHQLPQQQQYQQY